MGQTVRVTRNPQDDEPDEAFLTQAQPFTSREEMMEAIPDDADNAEVSLQKKDKAGIMRDCLRSLSADHREIIDLVYYHEKSVSEVAEILDIPEATVKTRMFYARKKLGDALRSQGVEQGWP